MECVAFETAMCEDLLLIAVCVTAALPVGASQLLMLALSTRPALGLLCNIAALVTSTAADGSASPAAVWPFPPRSRSTKCKVDSF